MNQIQQMEIKLFEVYGKDKITLLEAIKIDGRYSLSKVYKILAKIGDKKAQELCIIPKIHTKNGNKRLFRLSEVAKWIIQGGY